MFEICTGLSQIKKSQKIAAVCGIQKSSHENFGATRRWLSWQGAGRGPGRA
jgi:hypothetical protein